MKSIIRRRILAMAVAATFAQTGAWAQTTGIGTPTSGLSTNPLTYRTAEYANRANNLINADAAYARGWTGRGSTVLIMDTGINLTNPDIAGKVKYSKDFTGTGLSDSVGHGTHLAGIVAGARNGVGMHGVAFDAELAVAKIANSSVLLWRNANGAMAWASQYQDVTVANLSANVNYHVTYTAASRQVAPGVWINTHAAHGGQNYYNLERPESLVIPRNMALTISAGNQTVPYVQNPATFAVATDAAGNLIHGGRILVVGMWNSGRSVIEGATSGHMCKDYRVNTCQDRYRTSDFYILAPGASVISASNTGTGTRNMGGTSQSAAVAAGALAVINQMWPYMTPENQVQVLLRTANKNLPGYRTETHGQGLLDLDRATQPIGAVGISTTGRTGVARPISGSISVTGLSGAAQLSSVAVVDELQRDFRVNLTPMVNSTMIQPTPYMAHSVGQSWSSKYAGWTTAAGGVTIAGGSFGNTSISIDTQAFEPRYRALRHQITLTQTAYNPWINFSGMWGASRDATTLEYSAVYSPQPEGFWAQGGVMQTVGRYEYAMISRVTPIISTYAMAGYQTNGVNLYTGVKPVAVSGRVDFTLPAEVTASGEMINQTSTAQIRNPIVGFVGGSYRVNWKANTLSLTAMVAQDGSRSGGVQYLTRF